MSSVLQDLRLMRERLSDPAKWHKGDFFKGFPGFEIRDDAFLDGLPDCASCMYGALAAVREDTDLECETATLLESVLPANFNSDLVAFNDHPDTTHADVLAFLDWTIAGVSS